VQDQFSAVEPDAEVGEPGSDAGSDPATKPRSIQIVKGTTAAV
jgi:hypothetical protein